ncbi:NfeD family protein [Blautia sp. Sow4_E7]|uniref:NfeD family protein n=1 Tax=Blautia sp. Sow4_E7 TaxID=3438749 RepID=UPI003F934AB0
MEPIIWLGILAVLLVIEGLTTALTTIWFAGGALVAAIVAGVGMGIVPQLLLFFCVSLVLLLFTRPAALKLMNKGTEKTNVEGLLGKSAVVIQQIDNLAQTGQVRINDIEWMARTSEDSVTIPVGTVVVIEAVHGVRLIVRPQ